MTLHPGQPVFARVGKHKAVKGVVVHHFPAPAKPSEEAWTVRLPGERLARVFHEDELEHVPSQT